MIDLHCHILPGLDDGPATWREAAKMVKMAAADGIHTLVATPHIPVVSQTGSVAAAMNKKIEDSLIEMRHICTLMDLPLILMAGGELRAGMGADFSRSFALNGEKYVLIEFPHSHLPNDALEIVFNLVTAGLSPVIAHPERNGSVIESPGRLVPLVRSGALVQVTGASLLGYFGGHVKACARYLLKMGIVSFLASDAHSASGRPPVLSRAVRAASRIVGAQAAEDMVKTHPSAVLSGRTLPNRFEMVSERRWSIC